MNTYNFELEKLLKNAVREWLSNINISGLYFSKKKNLVILQSLDKENVIDDSTLESALEEAVLKRARKDYELITLKNKQNNHKIYAEHLPCPEFLVYGLEKKIFSEKELKKIPLENRDSLEKFINSYRKENLIEELKDKVLYGK